MGRIMTVAGAVGGIGTSTFAFALALACGAGTVLIDGQSDGVPLDILIGAERQPGTRWSQVRIRSTALDPATIAHALPVEHGVAVLAADDSATADAAAIAHLVEVLRGSAMSVVIDLPGRHPLRRMLAPDLDVLLVPPTLHGIAAARPVTNPTSSIVVVHTGREDVMASAVGDYLTRPVLGSVRWQRAVTAASVAGMPPPVSSDVMRLAAVLQGADGD